MSNITFSLAAVSVNTLIALLTIKLCERTLSRRITDFTDIRRILWTGLQPVFTIYNTSEYEKKIRISNFVFPTWAAQTSAPMIIKNFMLWLWIKNHRLGMKSNVIKNRVYIYLAIEINCGLIVLYSYDTKLTFSCIYVVHKVNQDNIEKQKKKTKHDLVASNKWVFHFMKN